MTRELRSTLAPSGDHPILRFLLTMGAWTLAGQAILASARVQAAVVVPFSRWQGELVERYVLAGPLTVSVDPTCSGLEVIALCLAATLSYPVPWRRRLTGAAVGVLLLLALNVVRITTLGSASQTAWFQTLHVNVWPTLLVAAAAGWIVVWIRAADRATPALSPAARRFAVWSGVMLGVYAVAMPVLTEAHVLDRTARGAARVAARVLTTFGADASVTEKVLRVRELQYLITPECVTTPLMAFYFAALFASPVGRRARVLGIIAALPLFAALAVLRLLTVAFPAVALGTPLVVTHAFNQILTGVAALVAASLWWRGARGRAHAVAVALLVAAAAAVVSAVAGLGYAAGWSALLRGLHLTVPPGLTPVAGDGDVQGALAILPIYQLALFGAAWAIARPRAGRARWVLAAATLIASQFAFLAMLGWMHAAGIRPLSALAIRGWAVAVPLLLLLAAGRNRLLRSSAAMNEAPA